MHGSEGGEAPAFPTPIMFDVCYGVCVGVRRLTTNLRNAVDWDVQREPRHG